MDNPFFNYRTNFEILSPLPYSKAIANKTKKQCILQLLLSVLVLHSVNNLNGAADPLVKPHCNLKMKTFKTKY